MAATCEVCGRATTDQKDRYCLPHARKQLIYLERVGYLEPLTGWTVDGPYRLSSRRFLTLPDFDQQMTPDEN